MKLWPVAIPRMMRFHDLRHTTATLLLRAGVDPYRVQRILRHKDVRTTTMIYGHLDVEDLRSAVNQLVPGTATAAEGIPLEAVVEQGNSGPFATPLLREGSGQKGRAGTAAENPQESPGP